MTPQGWSGLYWARKSEAGSYEIRAVSNRGEGYYEKANSFLRNSLRRGGIDQLKAGVVRRFAPGLLPEVWSA